VSGDHQEPSQPSPPDSETAHFDWPNTVDAAREATFQRLRSLVLENDPVPAEVIASARASFALRSIDDELASLVYDSMTDGDLFAGVRSGTRAVRQLSFEAGELVLEMEVTGARYLVGQVVPPQVAVIELRHRGGTTNVETDELGCFHFRAVPEGPVSFRCCPARPAAPPVATSWITL
jgi:hypothetical protein